LRKSIGFFSLIVGAIEKVLLHLVHRSVLTKFVFLDSSILYLKPQFVHLTISLRLILILTMIVTAYPTIQYLTADGGLTGTLRISNAQLFKPGSTCILNGTGLQPVTVICSQILNYNTIIVVTTSYIQFDASQFTTLLNSSITQNQQNLELIEEYQLPIDINGNVKVVVQGGGGVTNANQGSPNVLSQAWPMELTDGTNGPVAVTPASTAATLSNPALVVAISPNSIGQVDALVTGTGAAGAPAIGVVTIQGITSGTPVPVTGSISASNPSVGLTGTTAPTSATEMGFISGANLVGVSGSNPLPITGSISASNPSVGTNGTAIPGSSTQIGGSDGTNLRAVSTDSSGNVNVNVVSGGGSNPSVGTNGSPIPTSSALIGASDGTDLRPLLVESSSNANLRVGLFNGATEAAVTGSNALKVDNSAVTQPISASALPLPSNASTSTLQTTGNTTLTSINTAITSLVNFLNINYLSGMIETPQIKTYTFISASVSNISLTSIEINTLSGTATGTINISGTPVTGMTAFSITSSSQTFIATGANSVTAGQSVTFVISASSAPVDLVFTLEYSG
jgi:hypothetical protein